MLSQEYQPKVNEKRQVVGVLPGGVEYCLRPPTNRDLIAIEQWALESGSNIDKQLHIFSHLTSPRISYEVLLDLEGESMEVMGAALDLFPVFSKV
jgi:hypothetical protein